MTIRNLTWTRERRSRASTHGVNGGVSLAPDAQSALDRAGFSRRDFLKTSGAMIVAFQLRAQGPTKGSPAADQVDSWIAIAADGRVTAYSGKEELGQGISTAQTQLVAEELCVALDRVTLIYCDTAMTPDQAHTSGSQSHPANFNHANLALAAATAREALLRLASQRLNVAADQLIARNGEISARNDAQKRVNYGDLLGGQQFHLRLDPNAKRRPPSEWTVLGKPAPRADIPDLVTGKFEFVHNVRLPGMLHGRVVRPPSPGAVLASVDESSVKDLPGVVKVVLKKNFVGVAAQTQWQAMQAATKLKLSWQTGTALPDHAKFYDYLRNLKPTRDTLLATSVEIEKQVNGNSAGIHATYRHPYQMHGSMGSSCAVAHVESDRATVYSSTQAVWYQKNTLAMVLGLKPENLRVIYRRGSGCYGLNGADTVTYDAAVLSQAVGKPVRVQLSRKDEMAWENFGNAYVIDEHAVLDARGNIVAWNTESWSPTMGNRPGPSRPGNVITGVLLGFEPEPFTPHSPASEPTRFNNGSNAIPSYFAVRMDGVARGAGTIEAGRVLVHNVRSPFFTGPLRSPARLQNTFAHESFMDELAVRANADPVEFRLRHLSHPRLSEVVRAAAKGANWQTRSSPQREIAKSGKIAGRGISCVAYEGSNGYSAMVAEIEVDRETGAIAVKRIVCAIDCGPVSNPDGLKNQVEGGALQGMSRALLEQVTWDAQKITSFDWRTYRTLPLGFDVPEIVSVLIDRPDEEATGAGETSITVVAAAIGNAFFDATGVRLREVPFTRERVKAALA